MEFNGQYPFPQGERPRRRRIGGFGITVIVLVAVLAVLLVLSVVLRGERFLNWRDWEAAFPTPGFPTGPEPTQPAPTLPASTPVPGKSASIPCGYSAAPVTTGMGMISCVE